jgi:DNA-binding CsgD family transcriptional regulator
MQVQKELEVIRQAIDKLDQGLIILTRAGRVAIITSRAQQWLTKYFGKPCRPGDHLPTALQQWIRSHEAFLPTKDGDPPAWKELGVARGGKRLVVRLLSGPDQRLLILDEQLISPPVASLDRFGLTYREAEVLAWVARGKTNEEIGKILSVRPRTVGKHLENIYQKLGVENRTAAASLALTLNKPRAVKEHRGTREDRLTRALSDERISARGYDHEDTTLF